MTQATPTRRSFLRSVSGATAALAIPISVFAESQSTTRSSDKPLRWGVIGTGHRGSIHIGAIKNSPDDSELLAVCDVMENHLADGAKRAGPSVQTYTDYQKLLANADINAVLIATPNLLHKEIVLDALEAGKHVMCEKPMAISIDECKAMTSAAEKRPDQVVLYTMQLRYSPRYQELRKHIDAGKIGKPKHILMAEFRGDWNRGDVWQYDDPKQGKVNWRFSHAASGGTLNEKVCHYFDILHWMAGALPTRVSCAGGTAVYKDGRDTWDHATTTLVYPDGCIATHSLCMFGPKRLDLQVIGDERSISVGDMSLVLESQGTKTPLHLPEEIIHGQQGARGEETAVAKMYEDFADCVKNNKKPWMDAEKAMASSKTAWLGELSSDQKREVKWEELG